MEYFMGFFMDRVVFFTAKEAQFFSPQPSTGKASPKTLHPATLAQSFLRGESE